MSAVLEADRKPPDLVPPPDREVELERWIRWPAPLTLAILAIGAWDLVVRMNEIPPYILPGPALVLQSLIKDWPTLWPSLLVTLRITAMALARRSSAASGSPCCSRSRAGSSCRCSRSP